MWEYFYGTAIARLMITNAYNMKKDYKALNDASVLKYSPKLWLVFFI